MQGNFIYSFHCVRSTQHQWKKWIIIFIIWNIQRFTWTFFYLIVNVSSIQYSYLRVIVKLLSSLLQVLHFWFDDTILSLWSVMFVTWLNNKSAFQPEPLLLALLIASQTFSTPQAWIGHVQSLSCSDSIKRKIVQ